MFGRGPDVGPYANCKIALCIKRSWSNAQQAADKTIILCGSLANEDKLHDLFSKVFALYVDDETLKHRLSTRTTNDWGKQPHELAQTLEHHRKIHDKYQQRKDTIIDATKPLDKVVDDILWHIPQL